MEPWKVFVSSTRKDLASHREAVAAVLREFQLVPLAMETFGAQPADAKTVSKEQVADCDLFLGIYAFRHGYSPEGDGPSITEQEYEEARRLGKRRLCYVADESLRPPASEESPEKRARLERFKAAIDRDLVRGTFSSPTELAQGLTRDLARLLGDRLPLGYSRREVWQRWLRFEQGVAARLRHDELNDRTDGVPSPLEAPWRAFLHAPSWRDQIVGRLAALRREAESLGDEPETRGLLATAHTLDWDRPHVEITAPLLSIAREASRSVEELLDRLERPDSRASRKKREEPIRQWKRLRARLLKLAHDLQTPRFGRCLTALGSFGSGRTHFLGSLLADSDALEPAARPYVMLLLERRAGHASVEDRLLPAIRAATGLAWRDLAEVDRFLGGSWAHERDGEPEWPALRVVVAIDDLQRGLSSGALADDLESLRAAIIGLTRFECVHWLVLMHDVAYPLVRALPQRRLWEEYTSDPERRESEAWDEPAGDAPAGPPSDERHPPRIGPWWHLDEMDRAAGVGVELIRTVLRRRGPGPLALDAAQGHQSASDRLSHPFLAWVFLDLQERGFAQEKLVHLNYVEFVSAFWEARLERLDSTPLDQDEVRLTAALVARALAHGSLRPLHTKLLDEITSLARGVSELANRERAEAALRVLERANLLEIVKAAEARFGGAPVAQVETRFETFWAWQFAQQLAIDERLVGAADPEVGAWLEAWGASVEQASVKEATLSFLLLLVDLRAEGKEVREGLLQSMLGATLESRRLPGAAAWLMGPRASLTGQRFLAERAPTFASTPAGPEGRDAHTLFSFLFFLGEADPAVLAPSQRFALGQPLYPDIGEGALDQYFFFLACRWLDRVRETAELRRCWHALAGCEAVRITPELARVAFDRLAEICENEGGDDVGGRLTRWMLRYVGDQGSEGPPSLVPKGWRGERYYLWHWLITSFCDWIVGREGLEAAQILDHHRWYGDPRRDVGRQQRFAMRKEANLALGSWYRHNRNHADREAYLLLVRQLVESGDGGRRQRAFFLIRHTAPAERGNRVVVEAKFGSLLRTLKSDPRLDDLFRRFPTEAAED